MATVLTTVVNTTYTFYINNNNHLYIKFRSLI